MPMWRITLTAPQYPSGITMYIWIDAITGDTPSTIQNINILNHYVGMQYIEPDSIPELTYFPYIVWGMMFFSLLAFFINKRWFFFAVFLIYCGISALGFYYFWLWEYDYGHNLSPKATIKIEGQDYQPPLFGSQYLPNFKADSYPTLGGIAFTLGVILHLVAAFFKRK
jgi:copper chaperone NosL